MTKFSLKGKDKVLLSTALASALCLSTASADDTEVFFGQVDPNLDIFPNVMFVLDTSGSMNWKDGTDESRLERMKDALDTILDNVTNVNVGVMRFNGSLGGGAVLFPVTPIDKEICDQGECGDISAAPRASSSGHDAEESVANGSVTIDGNVLGLGSSNSETQFVGLHFDDLDIPQGATITSAVLEFTASNDRTGVADFGIAGELSPNALPFTDDDTNISDRPRTTTITDWTVTEGWSQGLTYQSDQINGVLQEIVNQPGWCGGNAVSLIIDGDNGRRSARSFDQSASDAPTLKYTFDSSNIPAGGGCTNKTQVSAIAASSDDAEQRLNRGSMIRRSGDLEMPHDRGNTQLIGLRFTDIKIPRGAIVTGASIEFETDRQRSNQVSLRIQGESTGNAQTFGSNKWNISNRGRTGASVDWDDLPAAATNAKVSTPDLTNIAQEIINRGDWASGNAMAFIFSHKSGSDYRAFETFDSEPVNAAKLRIQYQATANSSEPVVITARDKLKEVVNGLTATGGTPVVDAYLEAANYYRGLPVDYGLRRGYYRNKYHRVSVPDSYTGGTVNRDSACTDGDLDNSACTYESISGNPVYVSPFKSSCQTNHIVFLSDGAATSNSSANKVRALTGISACEENSGSRACGVELAKWLDDNDHSASFNGKQNVSTYTIGFNISSSFLGDIATAGGGKYFEASSADQLVNVFQSILGDVLAVDTSFVAPGATVNQFNRLTHRNDIYFALFKPDQRPTWSGNLKRYEVGEDPNTGEITIKDVNGNPAVDAASGFFDENSKSWWSDTKDGNQVAQGGAAAEMYYSESNPRKVYTYLGANSAIPADGVDLTATENKLSETNNDITQALLGIENLPGTDQERADYRDNLLMWARGLDLKDEDEDNEVDDWRMHMGDPMHARPVILNYANGDNPKTTVFVGTNEGYLHAIERDEGKELFSYVPKELLDNFSVFWNNQSSDNHPYGVDGTLSVWTTDENENVTIDSGEKAFLYTGMRRGGSSYYALNVADRESPRLAWVIDPTVAGFEELGQTWSKMTPTKIRYNGDELDVLIFGAGYDENQDWVVDTNGNQLPRTEDTRGRGFYIVNAETGALIYSALGVDGASQKFPDMDYSMPADLRILDTDFDGFADQIYASDLGGRIWRFDLEQFHQSGDLLKGGIIADLNGNGLAGERRFYYEPDVAIISHEGERFLSISIGSGWRAHPLDVLVDDRFYMIKSPSVFNAPTGYGKTEDGGQSYSPITEDDLVDVTNDLNPAVNEYGWKYDLGATGEKVLGGSVTANNQVIFTSYRPALSVGACTTAIGGGSVYALNILDGSPTVDMNGDGVIDEDDREKELAHGGIPPEPAILITDSGPTLLAGPEQPFKPNFDNLTRRTYWVDSGDDN